MRRASDSRPRPPDDIFFPVVPMLDMAFQLLAFFILTFQAPSRETWLGLDLPVAPAVLPKPADAGRPLVVPSEATSRLSLIALADGAGRLRSLTLDGVEIVPEELGTRLERASSGRSRPVRLTMAADDALRYDVAARLLAECGRGRVASVRLDRPAQSGKETLSP